MTSGFDVGQPAARFRPICMRNASTALVNAVMELLSGAPSVLASWPRSLVYTTPVVEDLELAVESIK
ncbi:hypothetical protein ACIFOE_04715 [Paenibacillus sp. NRS-1783]|uniref:hypothetical protein n=1 Tax=Paenibacillus sp. NRS-1783 TaxID=3233907 RepID=UPI003D2C35FE